jgi:hypothetical protein
MVAAPFFPEKPAMVSEAENLSISAGFLGVVATFAS